MQIIAKVVYILNDNHVNGNNSGIKNIHKSEKTYTSRSNNHDQGFF